uniref:U3 small nucleolar RNA-associated protein 6 N-terminal domain-containing protein n=1 Tax=Schistocephalus solidus TaxID=70667 RepID=A0A0X3P1G9_SCHSO
MAEVVERNIEESLDELSYIRKAKLFTEDEIRDIVRRRRQHEYSLQKRVKRITDYESYISTEIGILRLISIKRQKLEDFRFQDKIEKSIVARLVRLHRQICYRFQSRVDVWMRFIWFSRALGRHMSVVRLWDRLLQVHGRTDPRLWAAAAAFHLDQGARAQARSALGQLSVERRALAQAKRKVVRLRKVPSCSAESAALRLETKHLQSLRESLGRATRITWDRTLLRGLREARRLLTQGLAFNENSAFLLLELLKCEASAADFFRERVLLRRQQATAEHVVVPSSKRDRSVIRSEQTDRDDATAFLSEVTEDIDFIVEGGAVKLVAEQFLTFPNMDSETLSSALQVARSISNLVGKDLITKISSRLDELKKSEEAEQNRVKQQQEEQMTPSKRAATMASLLQLRERTDKLRTLLGRNNGVDEALEFWTSWYPLSNDTALRTLDPLTTEAFALLRARVEFVYVSHLNRPPLRTAESDVSVAVRTYNEYRTKHDRLVTSTRDLLDALATSNWGKKLADFWRLFMEFERKWGDCTRLPALEWRAQKTLEFSALAVFRTALVSKNSGDFF